MDILASPLLTVILNLLAGFLVSKGILDEHSAESFVQVANNVVAGGVTVGLGAYSISKMVEHNKNKMLLVPAKKPSNKGNQSPAVDTEVALVDDSTVINQTGLPLTPEGQ